MDEKMLLDAMRSMLKEELNPINERLNSMDKRLDSIDERLANVEEDTKITRNAVNDLLEWADDASIQVIPLFNRKAK